MEARMAKLEISKVHDAYGAGGECPLCALLESAEDIYLRSFQHSRVMEPNVRVQTNESGFCADHYRKLYAGENKLGLSLMLHTHLQGKLPGLLKSLSELSTAGGGRRAADLRAAAARRMGSLKDRCFVCDLLDGGRDRYAFTILYLWRKDPDFPAILTSSRGFCVPHFLDMLAAAEKLLRGDRLQQWLDTVVPLMSASLTRLEKELFSFTQLHRDSNRGLGTEEERTALARSLQKLAGGRFRLETSGHSLTTTL
jgi:hypothetical protein